tara:strand:- start:1286 stop:1387 length:102 start_codon:yes stop_codon:yes gene_type:complete
MKGSWLEKRKNKETAIPKKGNRKAPIDERWRRV